MGNAKDAETSAYAVMALLTAILVLIPFPWHLEAWNTGTCMYMLWTAAGCLVYGINAILWNGNVIDNAVVYCDIAVRIIVAISVAIPAASLCINRRLYQIASVRNVTVTEAMKRRGVIVDLSICLGIPLAQLIVQYCMQGHRYDIFENVGCFPFTYHTLPAFFLVYSWPMIIGLVSLVYCFLTIRAFARRRAQFKELLSSNNNLSSNRYFRLMALAGVEAMGTVPLGAYVIYVNAKIPQQRWISWEDTHSNFSRVRQIPAIFWTSTRINVIGFGISRWSVVVCGLIFFMFFGFAEEARRHYGSMFTVFAKRLGFSRVETTSSTSGNSSQKAPQMTFGGKQGLTSMSMPVYIHQETSQRVDDDSDRLSVASGAFNGLDDYTKIKKEGDKKAKSSDAASVHSTESSSIASTSSPTSSMENLPRIPQPATPMMPSPVDEYAINPIPFPPPVVARGSNVKHDNSDVV